MLRVKLHSNCVIECISQRKKMGKLKKQKGEEKWTCWSWTICLGCFLWIGLLTFVGASMVLGHVWVGKYGSEGKQLIQFRPFHVVFMTS